TRRHAPITCGGGYFSMYSTRTRGQIMTDTEATISDFDSIREAADFIRQRHTQKLRAAIILGTGLGLLADRIEQATMIPYGEIPHFPRSTAIGHAGRLVLGMLGGVSVAAMQGRFHLYEGYTPQQVVLPVRVLHLLGAEMLIATNAAGGLDGTQHAGDLL